MKPPESCAAPLCGLTAEIQGRRAEAAIFGTNRRIRTKTATLVPPNCNVSVAGNVSVAYLMNMTSGQFKRWLAKQGCTFETGKGGHLIVRLDGKMSVLPMHGGRKEIGKGLENRIKKDLGLK